MHLFKTTWGDSSVDRLFSVLCRHMVKAPTVNTETWQSKRDTPMSNTRELLNVVFELPIQATDGAWAAFMKPNLPWAESHFLERVSREPLNPPPSHVDWPYSQQANENHMQGQRFSHSYPERLWPTRAPMGERSPFQTHSRIFPGLNFGIRYRYGDLDDLVSLLVRNPRTRQAYVPLWFPEDLGAVVEEQRVPCTLGYHFILRGSELHCFYPMRSLDIMRYFRDDAYMAGRLCQWVIGQCRERHALNENSVWHEVVPGILTMHVVSCHIFTGDEPIIKHMLSKEASRYEVVER